MILFRARAYGSADPWTIVSIHCSDEDEGVEDSISQILGSALHTSPLHVQQMNDDGEWENLT